MKIGITIDPWKFKIFKKNLNGAGYVFTARVLNDSVEVLTVETDNPDALAIVVQKSQNECARSRLH